MWVEALSNQFIDVVKPKERWVFRALKMMGLEDVVHLFLFGRGPDVQDLIWLDSHDFRVLLSGHIEVTREETTDGEADNLPCFWQEGKEGTELEGAFPNR